MFRRIPKYYNLESSCQFQTLFGFSYSEPNKILLLEEDLPRDQFLSSHMQLGIYGKMYRSMFPRVARYYDYFIIFKLDNKFYAADPLAGYFWDITELSDEEAHSLFMAFNFNIRNEQIIKSSDIQYQPTHVDGFELDYYSSIIGAYYDSEIQQFEDSTFPCVPYMISEIEKLNPFGFHAPQHDRLGKASAKHIQKLILSYISDNCSRSMNKRINEISNMYKKMDKYRIVPGFGSEKPPIDTNKLRFFSIR